jgi:hypothetical protein
VTINAVAVTMQLSGGQLSPIFINEVLVAGAGSYLYTEQGTATTEPNLIPDQFTFIDKSNVPLGQFIQSDPITVTGLTDGFSTLASISGAATSEYRINGGSWITATASVNNGNTIEVRHQSSGLNSFDTNTTLALGPLGQVTDTFTSTTTAAAGGFASILYSGNVIRAGSVLFYDSGEHTGANGSLTLIDNTKAWAIDENQGLIIKNISDKSQGLITTNTPQSIATSLAGGFGNNFDTQDQYEIIADISASDTIEYSVISNIGGVVSMSPEGIPTITGANGTHNFVYRIVDASTSLTTPDYLFTVTI